MISALHCALCIKISMVSCLGLESFLGDEGYGMGRDIWLSWDWSLLLGCWPFQAPGQASSRLGAQGPGLESCIGPSLGQY